MNWFRRIDAPLSPAEPARRLAAARLIRDFVDGKITNDELDDGFPRGPGDQALNGVFEVVWLTYDDLYEHRFQGPAKAKAALLFCARFLESDAPYLWQAPPWPVRLVATVGGIATLGLLRRLWDPPPDYWPFPDVESVGPEGVPPELREHGR